MREGKKERTGRKKEKSSDLPDNDRSDSNMEENVM
jgi:hypothetical protein